MYVLNYLFTLDKYGKLIKHFWQVGNNSRMHRNYCTVVTRLHSSLNEEKPEMNIQDDFTAIPLCSCSNIRSLTHTDKLMFPLVTITIKGSCWIKQKKRVRAWASILLNPHFMGTQKKRLTDGMWSAALTAPSLTSSSSDFHNHLDNIYTSIRSIWKPKNPILCGYHVKKKKWNWKSLKLTSLSSGYLTFSYSSQWNNMIKCSKYSIQTLSSN